MLKKKKIVLVLMLIAIFCCIVFHKKIYRYFELKPIEKIINDELLEDKSSYRVKFSVKEIDGQYYVDVVVKWASLWNEEQNVKEISELVQNYIDQKEKSFLKTANIRIFFVGPPKYVRVQNYYENRKLDGFLALYLSKVETEKWLYSFSDIEILVLDGLDTFDEIAMLKNPKLLIIEYLDDKLLLELEEYCKEKYPNCKIKVRNRY